MDKLLDTQIRRGLKNWAAEKDPPANGRARLMLIAARSAFNQDQASSTRAADGSFEFEAVSDHLPKMPANGSFYQPLLWVLQFNLTPIKNVT